MKNCCHCKAELPLSLFGKDKSTKDGLKKTCKQCLRSAYRDYHKRNPEKATLRMRKWLGVPENKEKSSIRVKEYYWRDPITRRKASNAYKRTERGKARVARYNSNRRGRSLSQMSNITSEEIALLLVHQKGLCACCGKSFSESFTPTLDHILPLIKGGNLTLNNVQLLCRNCNSKKSTKYILYRDLLPDEIASGGY